VKLNWFSPLPSQHTDIAHYTARIAPALMSRFKVTFWTDLSTDNQALPPGADIRAFDPGQVQGHEFNRALFDGLNVYNFGNDARFHTGIAQVALRIPGLAILHDTRLHHFAFERARNDELPFSSYFGLASAIYGEEGEIRAKAVAEADGRTASDHAAAMPFVEAFVDNAIGAICHSDAAIAEVRKRVATPIMALPLPFASLAARPQVDREWAPPWRLVMFGYIHANRRVASILAALASWPEPADFHLDIFGPIWDQTRVERLIDRSGLGERVSVHGFIPEPALDEAIAKAHLAFNLRHPTMGEASGGILRAWSHATPALVTDAGWYADLPDGVARKISIGAEIADIHRALDGLVSEPTIYREMGVQARDRLDALHAPGIYAEALAQALAEWPDLMVRFARRRLSNRLGGPAAEDRRAEDARVGRHVARLLPLEERESAWRL
jgi:glycosyltransferase involved in cell wall biosynthesis